MMETDILSKNDTYHAINPAYPDTCCIHHLRYRSTYPYPLSSVVLDRRLRNAKSRINTIFLLLK